MNLQEFLKEVGGRESDIVVYASKQQAIEAVKRNGDALSYVKDQTEQICIEAVKQDAAALSYVKDQTEQICIEAVKRNGYALRYVNKSVFITQVESKTANAV